MSVKINDLIEPIRDEFISQLQFAIREKFPNASIKLYEEYGLDIFINKMCIISIDIRLQDRVQDIIISTADSNKSITLSDPNCFKEAIDICTLKLSKR